MSDIPTPPRLHATWIGAAMEGGIATDEERKYARAELAELRRKASQTFAMKAACLDALEHCPVCAGTRLKQASHTCADGQMIHWDEECDWCSALAKAVQQCDAEPVDMADLRRKAAAMDWLNSGNAVLVQDRDEIPAIRLMFTGGDGLRHTVYRPTLMSAVEAARRHGCVNVAEIEREVQEHEE